MSKQESKAAPLMAERPIRGRRLLSGVQPSGLLHLGNWFGAMQQHIELQHDNDAFYFIANYHSLTTVQDAKRLRELTRNVALDYLALGLDPSRARLFRQSDVPEVTELAWLLAVLVGMGDLERAVSYKDKVSRGIPATAGLFTYPLLMAADILIYGSEVVPVGEDQVQHIEMTRRFATRFNTEYGAEVFTLPQALLNEARTVPGLDGQKMSKSYGNTIDLFAAPKVARKAIMSIVTDSTPVEDPKDPERCNAFAILKLLVSAEEAAAWAERYRTGPLGYGEVKLRIFERYGEVFGPARERREALAADPDMVEDILIDGARRAREVAVGVMDAAREACGIVTGRR
ncbi:MAG: tryptophan--tRNA ligase [Myxococcales bacterium]